MLAQLALGHVAGERLAIVEDHLDGCEQCTIALAAVLAGPVGGTVPFGPSDGSTVATRYELGTLLGHGGMGSVYIAYDRWLGRDIAVKIPLAQTPQALHRFAREVKLAARLEHPNILPMYDAGQLPDGRCFGAMRLVDGKQLTEHIKMAAPATRLSLLEHVIATGDALAFAHAQGILHRDVKPQNIMVGRGGETWLADWGLAKPVIEPADATSTVSHATSAPAATAAEPSHASMALGTRQGTVVGTRAYMAPECASGQAATLQSDVYSLGATLFHAMTGHVREPTGERPPSFPSSLWSIVTKATATNPAARYANAAEMVADMRRFRDGQLVIAHTYSWVGRIHRWVQRHRALTVVTAAALCALIVIGIGTLSATIHARRSAEHARDIAESERDASSDLVRFMVGDLRKQLETVGRLDVMAQTGEQVVAYYRAAAHRSNSARDRHQLSDALALMGDAYLSAGDLPSAQRAYQEYLPLAQRAGGRTYCQALMRMGELHVAEGDEAAAIATFDKCRSLAKWHVQLRPTDLTWLAQVARAHHELARQYVEQSAWQAARDDIRMAVTYGNLLRAHAWPDSTQQLAAAYGIWTQIELEAMQFAAAREHANELLALATAASEAAPRDTSAHYALYVAHDRLGKVAEFSDDVATALAHFKTAHQLIAHLVQLDATSLQWQDALGTAEENLGMLAWRQNDLQAARLHLEASRDQSRVLLLLEPANPTLKRKLAVAEQNLGDLYLEQRRFDDASRCYENGIAQVAAAPRELAVLLLHAAELERQRHQPTVAKALLLRGVVAGRKLVARADEPAARRIMGELYLMLADVDRPGRAAWRAEARAISEPLRAANPQDSDTLEFLRALYGKNR